MKRTTEQENETTDAEAYRVTMNAEDVGATIGTLVMALGISLNGVASKSAQDWIGELSRELASTARALARSPGAATPMELAVRYSLGMIAASDPSSAIVPGETGTSASMASAAASACVVAKRRWPRETARHLAARAGTSRRAAQYWLDQRAGMSADALAELLRSDAGFEFLQEIVGTDQPTWLTQHISELKAAEAITRRIDDLRVEIADVRRGLA